MKKMEFRRRGYLLLIMFVLSALFAGGCSGEEVLQNVSSIAEDGADAGQESAAQDSEISAGDYSGAAYEEVDGNEPAFTKKQKKNTKAFEKYSELDSLGRCGVAFANICKEIMPTEERGEIGSVKPSGWHTVKYPGIVDGNYLYNRCHLIGYQLAGENANEKNLITGTRYLNVTGMLPFEDEVAEYVKETNNHVLYRVTPEYTGDNLVADGVRMEAYSVEDGGEGVSFHVFVYNVQPGIEIDYATGESKESGTAEESRTSEKSSGTANKSSSSEKTSGTYVINENTGKFHLPACSSVGDISAENRQDYQGSREKLVEQGYQACKRCNP